MTRASKVTVDQLLYAMSGEEYKTLQTLGDELGVTKEGVRQLIKRHNLEDTPSRQRPDSRKLCSHCNELVDPRPGEHRYPNYHKSCSVEYGETLWETIPCSQCETDIRIKKTDRRLKVRQKDYLFCSYRCSTLYRIANQTDNFGKWAKNSNKIRQRKYPTASSIL